MGQLPYEIVRTGTVTTSEATVGDVFYPSGLTLVRFNVANSGSQALNALKLQIKATENSEWEDLIGTSDWTTATDTLKEANTTDANTLAGGTNLGFLLRVVAAYAIRFRASVAASTTTLTVRMTGAGQCCE